MDGLLIGFVVTLVASIVGVTSWIFLPKDNPIEQAAEKIIKDMTGVDVDLSPEVPAVPKEPVIPQIEARQQPIAEPAQIHKNKRRKGRRNNGNTISS